MADTMKLIAYLSGGYPTMDKSVAMAELYVEGGCDAIEWNFPPRNPYLEADYIAEKWRQQGGSVMITAFIWNVWRGLRRRYRRPW